MESAVEVVCALRLFVAARVNLIITTVLNGHCRGDERQEHNAELHG
jgi:hypothetical protein